MDGARPKIAVPKYVVLPVLRGRFAAPQDEGVGIPRLS